MQKRTLLVTILSIIFVTILTTVSAVVALTGYNYYSTIEITNTTASDVTSRIEFRANAASLISTGHMQADADDIEISYGGVADNSVIGSLPIDKANWYTAIITVPANSTVQYIMWTGNAGATKDQEWVGDTGDVTYIRDRSSLDINDKVTIDATIDLDSLPTTETEIFSKEGAYELSVDNTNYIFRVFQAGAPVANQEENPDEEGNYIEVESTGAAWYNTVNAASPLAAANDGSYVYNDEVGTTKYITFEVQGIPEGADITAVEVFFRSQATTGPNDGYITPILYSDETGIIEGSQVNLGGGWEDNNEVIAYTGPTELQIGVIMQSVSASVYLSQIYAEVDYTPDDGGTTVTIAASTGEHDVQANYDTANAGAELRINVDGGAFTTAALGGNLATNDESIEICQIAARINDLVLDDNGTDVIDIDFEPEEISFIQTGTADAGTTTTLDDAVLTEANDYWNGWAIEILTTTDNGTPQGEIAAVTDFDAANDRLTFQQLTATIDAGDTYRLQRWADVMTASSNPPPSGSGTYYVMGSATAGSSWTVGSSGTGNSYLTVGSGVGVGSSTATLVDDALTQSDNYWSNWYCTIYETTDRLAPEGETRLVTSFDAGTDTLHFDKEAFTVAPDEDDMYILWRGDVIQDLSASMNDTIVIRDDQPSNVYVTVGGLYPASVSVPGSETNLSPGVGGTINPPSNWSGTEEGGEGPASDTIPGQIIGPLSDVSGVDSQWIWWFAYGLLCLLIFAAVLRNTGINLQMGWIAIVILTALFVAYGPIPWWFLIAHIIGCLGVLTMERSPSV